MSRPSDEAELQSFLQFVQYLAKLVPNLSEATAPLRQLLENNVCWHWEEAHETAFIKLKDLVANAPVLRYFDPKEPTTLSVDASSKGLGAVILQQDKPIHMLHVL